MRRSVWKGNAAVYLLWMVVALTGAPLLALWGGVFGGCCTGLAVALAATLCHACLRKRKARRAEERGGTDGGV